ncbi:hypothetical protein KUA24_63 [Vibrio phage HNL01]|nr:hypothetical protein KUA24_63 [Vibrio phage HNL01]
MNSVIISVKYSCGSAIGEGWISEELQLTPLHTNPVKESACIEECSQFWRDMLDQLHGETLLEVDTLYSTVFRVDITYSEDYWGEVDVEYNCTMISHSKIAVEGDDLAWLYDHSEVKPDKLFEIKC